MQRQELQPSEAFCGSWTVPCSVQTYERISAFDPDAACPAQGLTNLSTNSSFGCGGGGGFFFLGVVRVGWEISSSLCFCSPPPPFPPSETPFRSVQVHGFERAGARADPTVRFT